MKPLLLLALLAASCTPTNKGRSYLVSIVDIPLKPGESMESFAIATWGVQFGAVCAIPGGWRIKAGNSATPDGDLQGEGSHGATWFSERSPAELRNFALVTLHGEVQREDVAFGPDATFKGHALISTEEGERKAALDYRNVRLTPARRCP
ncbi:hypothetical protein P1X14_05345 [Sphingomonas sp. AOB5]|uniref:hypothetical protein n=1 Tax=Sphingomonas sp. AOB5 TaxID=3034017 RepID=UPI0023F6A8E1|nr:hypothetical protein [Sphingomonas sp. AOB5]MDF7774664.1 hypothetical protein [Sphingomonas sp. AOB5]